MIDTYPIILCDLKIDLSLLDPIFANRSITTRMETKKVILVGDAHVGKTTLVQCVLTGEYSNEHNEYIATLGVEVHPIVHQHPIGVFRRFNVWDCAGDPRFGGLGEGYYIQAQIAIVMYNDDDENPRVDWISRVRNVCPHIPIVKVVNHFNSTLPLMSLEEDTFHINLVSNEGIEELFNYLMLL